MINMKNEAQSAFVRVLYAGAAAAFLGACTQTAPAPTATTTSAPLLRVQFRHAGSGCNGVAGTTRLQALDTMT